MVDPRRHPSPPPLDVGRVIEALNRHGVDFVVIGGIAVLAHGNPRATFDVDLVASLARDNLRRLSATLEELNAELAGVDAHLLDDPTNPDDLGNGANWTLHTDAGRVDFFSDVPGGRPYEEIRLRSVWIDDPDGASFRVVGLDDLIRMKRAAHRPKDLADIAAVTRGEGHRGVH